MADRRESLRGPLRALALLLAVSLYRQLSLRFLPDDLLRPYLVYAVYLTLLLGWGLSIRRRFTQRNMRLFLLAEVSVMLLWLTVRFVQEAFVSRDVYLVRILGYWIIVPAVAVPLLGLYAAFGLGRGDEYRFSRRWYLLLLPAAVLIALALTNESHHFLYRALPGEAEPNLYFHPNYGIFIVYGWGLALIAGRTVAIYRRNRPAENKSALQKLAPFLEPLALLAFCTPYTLLSFSVRRELIEFSAGVFYLEAVSWELFIRLGLIPVNTQYKTVFDRSTAGMQIVSEDGEALVRSASAPALTAEQFAALRARGTAAAGDGQELQAYRIQDGWFVWQRDVSRLRAVIDELQKTAAELEQESALLAQELRLRSEEAAVAEQNRIYNQLTLEVGPQLRLLRQLLARREDAADPEALFREICLVGTYVKRRCSLRLIEQTDGAIPSEDLALSFRELAERLGETGADARLRWETREVPSPRFALLCFDVFEFLLEREDFALAAAEVAMLSGGACDIAVVPAGASAVSDGALARLGGEDFALRRRETPGGYTVELREGGTVPC